MCGQMLPGYPTRLLDILWAAFGASAALAAALQVVAGGASPFLLFSLGGSTVFLFALTGSESAQPRALLGGHLGGAVIGILCYQALGDGIWVSVTAVVLTMAFMMATRTIHPPAGANPLIMVHHKAGLSSLVNPVGAGILVLFLAAVAWSRIRPGVRYPVRWW